MIARIANHAREHGFEVGQTYCDDAKSGLEIRRRTGLSQLLPGRLRSTSRRVPEIRMVRNPFEPIAEPEISDAAPEMLVQKFCLRSDEDMRKLLRRHFAVCRTFGTSADNSANPCTQPRKDIER
jgi:hypothetical protein